MWLIWFHLYLAFLAFDPDFFTKTNLNLGNSVAQCFFRGEGANLTHNPPPFSAGVDLTLKDHQYNNIKHNFDNYLVFICYICFVKYNIEHIIT